MPLRCLDGAGQSIRSFDYSDHGWQGLARENRRDRHLRMPCCASQVVLKTSPRGIKFFAHKALGECTTAPETEEHLHLKRMAVTAARANGWMADTEITGATAAGAQWKADVLAEKGKHKVAVEIQWSGQTGDETLQRQQRYRESGIRGLWLLRQPGFRVTHELPAVCIGGSLEGGFQALIPGILEMSVCDRGNLERWHQALPMDELLDAVFAGRFKFGAPLDMEAAVSIWGAPDPCWSCGAETMVVTRIEIRFGPNAPYFSLAEFGERRDLVPILLRNLPSDLSIGEIKFRPSHTMGETYLSNSCAHCGTLYGETYAFALNGEATELHSFPIRITPSWKRAIEGQYGNQWSVYPEARS